MLKKLVANGGTYIKLVDNASYDVGFYKPKLVDLQMPHVRDEVYVIASGHGRFLCGDVKKSFVMGDMLHVPSGVNHKFVDFSDDFSTWVIFFGSRPATA
jgi:mannose-6-phosphate isomerase-like protein (cupin superfamily)